MKSVFCFKKHLLPFLFAAFVCLSVTALYATNPPITNNLINLSQGLLGEEYEDYVPEMIIEGNIIHALWTTRVNGDEGYLFYCRSTDLGETWEQPKQLYQYINGNYSNDETAKRLAVSGDNVYIGIADYNYGNNGTGYIYFIKSSDSGASFGEVTELDNSGGGYSALSGCFIKASGSKVALVYRDANYNNAMEGLYCLSSSDNGNTFNKTTFSEEYTNNIVDMLIDGNQIIVIHEYAYYYYGLNTGRVFVSVSNDNGASFTTNKVSVTYTDEYGEKERCRCYHDVRYVPKVAKDGNTIHLIFTGNIEKDVWTLLYARSTDNGQTFEETVDINKGHISNIQSAHESLVAKNGHVYMEYLSTSSKVYLVRSEDGGATLTEPQDLMTESTHYIQTTWWPQLAIDPSDESGKTVYFGAGAMMTRKSADGGESFHNTTYLFPIHDADVKNSVLQIDNEGLIHWLSKARISHYPNYDYDIFYCKKKNQPESGEENKAYHLVTTWNDIQETSIVPSSPSIEFDSVMTGEAWVKMKPESGYTQSIFAKVNGYDGYFYNSPGYQISFDDNYGKRRFEAGIQTDKGEFINWTNTNINDTLWHHVAFTYDANAGLLNFKSYLDGLLIAEQTVTGEIIPGDGMLLIGSRRSVNNNAEYMIDDIRLWNRALTQKELIENQTKTFTGEEDSLKLWLNFDDTFKDLSGNGNDAVPLYLGNLESSDFDPPVTDFDMYQVANEISFNNKTTNATSYLWDFGDENTSAQGNPKYTYSTSGEYDISLTAQNNTTATSAIGHATIEGLDRVEPSEAGNYGYTTITVFGGGLSAENTKIILRKDGEEDIEGSEVFSEAAGTIASLFNLSGTTLGDWDVVVSKNSVEMSMPGAFTIIEGEAPDPWVNITGGGLILFNMWKSYTINYGNNGNSDAFGVPLWIAITEMENLEVEFIDFEIAEPAANAELGITGIKDSIPLFFVADEYFSADERARIYPLYIPKIPANSTTSIHIRIKSPASFNIETWVSDPFFTGDTLSEKSATAKDVPFSEMNAGARACIGLSMAKVVAEGLVNLAQMALPVGCINSMVTTFYNPWDYKPKGHKNDVPTLGSTAWQMSSVLINCAGDLPYFKAFKITVAVAQLAASMYDAYQADKACREAWLKKSGNKKGVAAVSSYDPNEMIGPSGFGDQNFIVKNNLMPYTILFENKSSASAPAHIVTVSDTLDLSVFDISNFGFSSFGWGDTIFTPVGNNLKEFSEDIDLRPGINLITRVSAKLDTITGIIKWEFLSLNPETMDIEEDPLVGFLPPNVSSPEGEGFVSFSVGLKEELVTNSEIRNQATIVFDANEPIITNEYLNTLDLTPPQSQVYPLDAEIKSNFDVSWTGSDEGSGISGYTIYVLENDTALYPWLLNTDQVTDVFHGELGSTYKFYSIATDNVNLMESEPAQYDAATTVTVDIEGFELVKEELTVFPNPANDNLKVTLTNAPCGMYAVELVSVNGSLLHSRLYDDFNMQEGIIINVENCDPGQYVLRVVFGNKSVSRKIMIQ